MNAKIRSGLALLSLTVGVVQMAHAATYNSPQQSIGSQQIPQDTKIAQSDHPFAFQPLMAPIPNDRAGGVATQKPTHLRVLQFDYNSMTGGGS